MCQSFRRKNSIVKNDQNLIKNDKKKYGQKCQKKNEKMKNVDKNDLIDVYQPVIEGDQVILHPNN